MSNGMNQDIWQKAQRVSQGIQKLIRVCTYFYLYFPVERALKEYGTKVFINEYDKFTVKLDDGTDYELIQPCPHLIYDLYDAKNKVLNGESDVEIVRKANAYDKFEPFFNWMISYVDTPVCG